MYTYQQTLILDVQNLILVYCQKQKHTNNSHIIGFN